MRWLTKYGADASGQSVPASSDSFISPTGGATFIGADTVHNLYDRFCAQRNKPFMLGETGAAKVTSKSGQVLGGMTPAQELAMKQSW
jgi:hypothetical protein